MKKLVDLARQNQRDKAKESASHEALIDAIWEADADKDVRQADIVRATGLTRERIRQICDGKYRARVLARRQSASRAAIRSLPSMR